MQTINEIATDIKLHANDPKDFHPDEIKLYINLLTNYKITRIRLTPICYIIMFDTDSIQIYRKLLPKLRIIMYEQEDTEITKHNKDTFKQLFEKHYRLNEEEKSKKTQ